MNERNPQRVGVGGIIFIVLALVVLALLATRKSRTLGLHQAIQFDDFFFTVEAASRFSGDHPLRKDGESAPELIEHLVRINVENRAKRVPFRFDGRTFAFVDLSGSHPRIGPSRERLPSGELTAPLSHVLKAGESVSVDYIFALPPDLEDLRLRVMPGGPVGELLEWLIFGLKQFQLPLSSASEGRESPQASE
jgi:hypothetical protein